jgi:hypothetical protein
MYGLFLEAHVREHVRTLLAEAANDHLLHEWQRHNSTPPRDTTSLVPRMIRCAFDFAASCL